MDLVFFDFLPVWGIYICLTLFIMVSFEIGYQISFRLKHYENASSSTGPLVGGLLGMLGFVLAFTFAMAASQHSHRKQSVLDEANAIGVAYLRADLIDDTHKDEVKKLLREYVDIRLEAVEKGMNSDILKAMLIRSVAIHAELWNHVVDVAKEDPSSNTSLLIQSINKIIDMHENRVTAGLRNRIPLSIWITLFVISALVLLTIGAQTGFSKSRRLIAVIPLIMAYSALTTVVVDLDRPQNGIIKVGQESMINLQRSMKK